MGKPCFAAERIPSSKQTWMRNQRTAFCTGCERKFGFCHYCRGVSMATPPEHTGIAISGATSAPTFLPALFVAGTTADNDESSSESSSGSYIYYYDAVPDETLAGGFPR